jgi:hypothetical protein
MVSIIIYFTIMLLTFTFSNFITILSAMMISIGFVCLFGNYIIDIMFKFDALIMEIILAGVMICCIYISPRWFGDIGYIIGFVISLLLSLLVWVIIQNHTEFPKTMICTILAIIHAMISIHLNSNLNSFLSSLFMMISIVINNNCNPMNIAFISGLYTFIGICCKIGSVTHQHPGIISKLFVNNYLLLSLPLFMFSMTYIGRKSYMVDRYEDALYSYMIINILTIISGGLIISSGAYYNITQVTVTSGMMIIVYLFIKSLEFLELFSKHSLAWVLFLSGITMFVINKHYLLNDNNVI